MENEAVYIFDHFTYYDSKDYIIRASDVKKHGRKSVFPKNELDEFPIVARGFAAYLIHKGFTNNEVGEPISMVIKLLTKVGAYEKYFKEQTQMKIEYYQSLPEEIDSKELFRKVIMSHLEKEQEYLNDSLELFNENDSKYGKVKQAMIKAYCEDYLNWVDKKISKKRGITTLNLRNDIKEQQLKEIADYLVKHKVIPIEDKELFLIIFQGYTVDRKVRWSPAHGNKSSLFALIYNMTNLEWDEIKVSLVKNFFVSMDSKDPILTNWKSMEYTRLTDKLLLPKK